MKRLIILFTFLSMIGFSIKADEIDDLFAGGEDQEFVFERFSEDNVMAAIAHDAGVVCEDGLCKLTSVDTKWKDFTININGGIGNNASNGFGGFGDGGGTFIDLGNNSSGNVSFSDRFHAGINMRISVGTCTRSVNIPRSLYYSINRYMYGLMNEDSTVRRSFTPADEAMIMFYTTVMKQVEGCR
jgi:hypothetical protein